MLDERQVSEVWSFFKEYLEKKSIATAAERYVDLLADYGISDEQLKEALGHDAALDAAIYYYLDIDEDPYGDDDDWDE
jgi:uncharacterized protein (DUF433 family)